MKSFFRESSWWKALIKETFSKHILTLKLLEVDIIITIYSPFLILAA